MSSSRRATSSQVVLCLSSANSRPRLAMLWRLMGTRGRRRERRALDWGVPSEGGGSVPRSGESALLRGYPLCQGRPSRAHSEGGRADPLTLCAAKRASRTATLRPLQDPLCRQAERRNAPQRASHTPPRAQTQPSFSAFGLPCSWSTLFLVWRGQTYHTDASRCGEIQADQARRCICWNVEVVGSDACTVVPTFTVGHGRPRRGRLTS